MKNISLFFIQNAKFTTVLSLGMVYFGYVGYTTMNAESFPSVSLATAIIVTAYDGATATDIETKITKPIEDEIRGVTGLKDVKSISQSGISTIVVQIDMDDPKVDVDKTMTNLQKAVDRTQGLPADLKDLPNFTELKSDEFPVMEIAVIGSDENRKRNLVTDLLKESLEDNTAVKQVRPVGYKERAFDIFLDLEKMKSNYISVSEVMRKIQSRNSNTPGGPLRAQVQQQLVRVEGKIKNVGDLENLVVRSNFSGKTILLGEIATIKDSSEESKVISRYNGDEATLLVVTKKAGADTIEMVSQLDIVLKDYQTRFKDLKFVLYFSEGLAVKNRVEVLQSNAISGLVLVIIFMFMFLPGKVGIATSISLPLAILGTIGVMPAMGMNLDAISVLGLVIALGMLVDNSIVISDNFIRLRREGFNNIEASINSIEVLWLPIAISAFTTIAAFLPMLVTKGILGQFIKAIPILVTISLMFSLFESFLFLPMRLVWSGKNLKQEDLLKVKTFEEQKPGWYEVIEIWFEKLMSWVVVHRYLVFLGFICTVGFSLFMMTFMNKFELFPAEQTEIYVARLEMAKGTRLEQTHEKLKELTKKVKDVLKDDVVHIVSRAGISQMDIGDPKSQEGNNVGMLSMYVSDNAKFNRLYTDVLKDLKTIKTENVESLTFQELINGPPVGNAIEATFRSNSEEDIYKMIGLITTELKKIDGIENLKIDDVVGDDEVFVDIDYAKASRLGIDVESVGSTIRTAISGNRISDVTLDNKEIDLILRFEESFRENIDSLKQLVVNDPMSNLVELSSFATFRVLPGTPQIKRFDFKRAKTLTGDVDNTKITSIEANALLSKVYEENIAKFPGINLVFGGAQESTNDSMSSLFAALNLSLIGIFAILVFLFRSYLRPLIIMTTIPLGLFGFSIAFYLHDRPVSFLALIGIIGLGGVIVNSGIILISFIDELRAEEKNKNFNEVLVKATGLRLRAVIITSLTTVVGLFPTAYGIGGNDPLLIPMTLALAWGLTSGTILTLIWIPAAYGILEDFDVFMKEKVYPLIPKF